MDNNGQLQLFNPAASLKAQIDSGYRNTDYAIAEILDNSIEAKARNIDVFLVRSPVKGKRTSYQVKQIVIVDDGIGMSRDILSHALTFGYGTHIEERETLGRNPFGRMGKFGYGLPNSSVSQADEVHVWSWKNGISSALHTSLDVERILHGLDQHQSTISQELPYKPILKMMEAVKTKTSNSGTIVYWNKTNRCTWKSSSSLYKKIEKTAGRIFRKFIGDKDENKRVSIRISIFDEDHYEKAREEPKKIRPNDPLFLMNNSITEDYIDAEDNPSEAIFKEYPDGEANHNILVEYEGNTYEIQLRFSIVKEHIRAKYFGSSRPLVDLVGENRGLSICRAGRELQLSHAWVSSTETIERWWGAEIDFPPELDSVFGVTNNKQAASKLEKFATEDIKHFEKSYEMDTLPSGLTDDKMTLDEVFADMQAKGDMDWVLIKIKHTINQKASEMHRLIRKMREGVKSKKDETPSTPSAFAPKASDIATQVDGQAPSNQQTPEDLAKEVKELIEESHHGQSEDEKELARKALSEWFRKNEKTIFFMAPKDSSSFFTIMPKNGKILITLNENHPALDCLFYLIKGNEENDQGITVEKLKERLNNIQTSIGLLLYSWADVEINGLSDERRSIARTLREQWGVKYSDLLEVFKKQLKSQ